MREQSIDYLQRDSLGNIDLLEPIRRGTAEIVEVLPDGVLLYETAAQMYILTCETPASAMHLIGKIESVNLVATHQDYAVPMLIEKFGLRQTMCCYQAAWLHPQPPMVPSSSRIAIDLFRPEMAEKITSIYSHQIGVDYIRGRIKAGELFGAYRNGELAGFIGLHAEGSMGMLEITPPYRRMGIATQLVSYLCAFQLARGRIPFSQFTQENAASRKLHERLGFAISDRPVFWLER